MKRAFLLLSAATLAFASCKKDDDKKNGIYKGPVAKFHNGKAWTWVQELNGGTLAKHSC